MNWNGFFDPITSGRLCLTLLHSVWQVPLLALVAWCVDRFLRDGSLERRYAVHVAALLAALVVMPITYALIETPLPVTAVESEPVARVEVSSGGSQLGQFETRSIETHPIERRPTRPFAAGGSLHVARPSGTSSWWLLFSPWIVVLYLGGVSLMLTRLLVTIVRENRLGARVEFLTDGPLVEALRSLAERWSMRVVPALARAEHLAVPKVVGFMRPVILLPASAASGLSTDELEMILAHELAHVRRYDTWVNLMQRLAEVLLFFNPALWYLSRRISTLREYCCDEMTCRAEPDSGLRRRVGYAAALLRVVELAKPETTAVASSNLASLAADGRSPSEIRRRVARLFGEPLREPLPVSRGTMLTAVLLGVLLAVGLPAWNTRAESDTERVTVTDTDTDTESDANTESDNESDTESESDTCTKTDVETKIEAKDDTQSKSPTPAVEPAAPTFCPPPPPPLSGRQLPPAVDLPPSPPSIEAAPAMAKDEAARLCREAERELATLSTQSAALESKIARLRHILSDGRQILLHVKYLEIPRNALQQIDYAELAIDEPDRFHVFPILEENEGLRASLQALLQNNRAKVLAEPTLVTRSGRPAYFRCGDEVPIQQGTSPTVLKFLSYGIQVDFMPVVISPEKIRLGTRFRMRDIDKDRRGIRVREIETALEMRFGQTLVICLPSHERLVRPEPERGLVHAILSEVLGANADEAAKQPMECFHPIMMVTPELSAFTSESAEQILPISS